jgi:DNA-binding beta-propeller fold protein YncE
MIISFLFSSGGCFVDDSLLDAMACDENNLCAPGYSCYREPCTADPAYMCNVCLKEPTWDGGVQEDSDGGTQDDVADQDDLSGTESSDYDPQDNDCGFQVTEGLVCLLAGAKELGYADGMSTEAHFNQPRGLLSVPDLGILVADRGNHAIRLVTAEGQVSTFAGNGFYGLINGPAEQSRFYDPTGLALVADGTILIADRLNHCIRKIDSDKNVSTLAGGGQIAEFQNGPSDSAKFAMPTGVAVNGAGMVFVADSGNHCIRKIADDHVTTFAGLCESPGYQDGPASEARFRGPTDICILPDGNLAVSEESSHTIRLIDENGRVSTLAGTSIAGYLDGDPLESQFFIPAGTVWDTTSNSLLVADSGNHRIRAIGSQVTTLAGTGAVGQENGLALDSSFTFPSGLAFLDNNRLVIADTQNHVLRIYWLERP